MMSDTLTSARIISAGHALVESPRWHDGALWFADWGAGQVLRLGPDGRAGAVATSEAPPLSFDFLPDGRMLIVASRARQLLVRETDGRLVPYAALGGADGALWNEIVVDGRGVAYVNGPGLTVVSADRTVRHYEETFAFPNGMAVTPDNATLIVAESHGQRLTAFDIAADGSVSGRRIWAPTDGPPDGVTIDAEGCVWYADVPNKRCVRVREGGAHAGVVSLDRGAFACMLGGPERRTLYITAAEWKGFEGMSQMGGTGQVLAADAPAPGVGWP